MNRYVLTNPTNKGKHSHALYQTDSNTPIFLGSEQACYAEKDRLERIEQEESNRVWKEEVKRKRVAELRSFNIPQYTIDQMVGRIWR